MRVSNILDPDQARHFVGPDLVQTVCKGYQKPPLVEKELRVNYLPTEQADTSVFPVVAVVSPSGQRVHSSAPVKLEYVPRGHS